ncbi:hypothetical protein CFC21_019407 [Triticum aestivum]|uniref:BSD domain-containing protein n=4 Tax=Triticum TaxID=4564 RepID=A0A9R1RDI7_TRITD|nr:hypothetical protein TRIUR3_01830 [Triticum urartu]KAF7004157.1 hypothetical protein CFC21_019407 [Triticum aestivum]VAH37406.1 unnamed protein product [Triticum turgidum subsp. durum]
MAFPSFTWPFRRRAGPSKPSAAEGKEEDAEALGVTPQLLDFLRTLSPDAFKSSALQLHQGTPSFLPSRFRPPASSVSITDGDAPCCLAGASAEAAGELSDWQQRHAVLVLARAKELAKVRYDLCPRHMKDKQFWTIYFLLARTYILPYELRAIQKEKVRRMETENGKSKDVIAVEVEMQESKCSRESQTLPDDSEPQGS